MHRVVNLEGEYFKALIYGKPGSGKTRLAATAAADKRMGRVLMLEAAGNPLSFRSYADKPDIIHMDKLEDFNYPYDWLYRGQPKDDPFCKEYDLKPPYGTVIIDQLTEVQRYSFNSVAGNANAKPGNIPNPVQIQHFGRVLAQMTIFAKLYIGLPMNVILVAQEDMTTDSGGNLISIGPLLWGKSDVEVASYAYLLGRMMSRAVLANSQIRAIQDSGELKPGEELARLLYVQETSTIQAKDQYGTGHEYFVNPTIASILDAIVKATP